jgi:hypothetical protein
MGCDQASKPKRWKRRLIALAVMAGLVAAFYAAEDIGGALVWRRFKAQWEAKGERFDFAAFIPPPVPHERNFATTRAVESCCNGVLNRRGPLSPENRVVIDQQEMAILGPGGNGPTNSIGNWQKALCINLQAWQKYYWDLAHPTNQPAPQNNAGPQYVARYGLRSPQAADAAPGSALRDDNAFPVPAAPQTPAADVLLALSKFDAIIEKLRQAAALPNSRFPIDYATENPVEIGLPHLAVLDDCVTLLRLRSLSELEAGQSEAALADIGLALHLTDKFRSEPFLISQLVRVKMLQTTGQPIWEGLVKHRWHDAQISQLDQQLAGFNFVTDFQSATRAQLAYQVAVTEHLRRNPDELFEPENNGFDRVFSILLAHGIPSGWFYRNELNSSRVMLEGYLPAGNAHQQTISPGLLKKAEASVQQPPLTPFTIISKSLLHRLTGQLGRFAYAQGIVNLSRTSCALERYRLVHGNYPETLDVLAPRFIDKVPRDPVNGEPLHYRAADKDHFLLYSVGWNEKDDGGTVSINARGRVDPDAGDWVWRSPE